MTRDEMRRLIESVCEEFKRDTGLRVTEQAIDELYNPTLDHLDEVTKALRAGRISEQFLKRSVRSVLDNSVVIAEASGDNYVGFASVKGSMKRECPYVFWC